MASGHRELNRTSQPPPQGPAGLSIEEDDGGVFDPPPSVQGPETSLLEG